MQKYMFQTQRSQCIGRRGQPCCIGGLFPSGPIILLWLCFAGLGNGQDYEVFGEIEWNNCSPDGAVVLKKLAAFEVVVNECKWWIKIVPKNEPVIDYHEISFDGTNMFYFSSIARDVEKKKKSGEAVGDNVAVGGVYPIVVPHISLCHEVGPIWLAYASGCYFREKEHNDIEPVGPLNVISGRDYEENAFFEVHANRQFMEAAHHLPERIYFIDDGMRKYIDPFGRSYTKGRLSAPFENGYTNTTFEVLATTHSDGVPFPRTAEFKTYWISASQTNGAKLFLMHRYRIDCNQVARSLRKLVFPPTLPGSTLLNDTRWAKSESKPVRSIVYSTDKRVPTDLELKASSAYAQALKEQISIPIEPLIIGNGTNSQISAGRWLILTVLGGSTVIFLFLLVRKRSLKQNN